jgi:hypothetical protein
MRYRHTNLHYNNSYQNESYVYDPAGNLTWPDGYSVCTDYDALNRPLRYRALGDIGHLRLGRSFRRCTLSLGNGTISTNSYNAQGVLPVLRTISPEPLTI